MTRRAISISVAICATALLAIAGSAVARSAAPTTVTIHKQSDGFFGFVDSTRPHKCANNRKVVLFKELGDSPHPRTDKKIGSDTAQPNGNGYEWDTGNTGNQKGNFYAFAHKIDGCKKGISDVVSRH